MALKLERDNGEDKINAVGTIDAYRRYLQVLLREPEENYNYLLHWIDNVAGYSNAISGTNKMLVPLDMYESMTFLLCY